MYQKPLLCNILLLCKILNGLQARNNFTLQHPDPSRDQLASTTCIFRSMIREKSYGPWITEFRKYLEFHKFITISPPQVITINYAWFPICNSLDTISNLHNNQVCLNINPPVPTSNQLTINFYPYSRLIYKFKRGAFLFP